MPAEAGKKEDRTFATMTEDCCGCATGSAAGCTHVAIESTGVYWKPVFNILEGVLEVILVNAQHVKAYKARKTDVSDAEWLADLLRHGLLKASFIPPLPIRELRELTRYRERLVRGADCAGQSDSEADRSRATSSWGKWLGCAGGEWRVDAACVGGRRDRCGADGSWPAALKRKQPELQRPGGAVNPSPTVGLEELLDQYDEVEAALKRGTSGSAGGGTRADPFVPEAVPLLDTIPGVGESIAEIIVAEIGVDMGRFPTDDHLASWAGVCPGNNESAGKRGVGKTTKGSRYLTSGPGAGGVGSEPQKGTYLAAQYQRLVKRMGKKKALVAVGHSILVIVYHVLKNRTRYQELGGDYFERQHVEV